MLPAIPTLPQLSQVDEVATLADAMPVLIWSLTPQGEPSFVNRRLCEWMGIDAGRIALDDRTVLAREVCTAIHPDDSDEVMGALTQSLATGRSFAMRYRQLRLSGDYRWLECRMEPQREDDGRILRWLGAAQDVEDEIRGQESLQCARAALARSMQAASLSELSASIAHEVGQPLTAILADSSAFRRRLSANPPDTARALAISERILHQAERAALLVDRIRALFRHDAGRREIVSVNDVLEEVRLLVGEEIAGKRISLTIEPAAISPEILVDRVQIQQVLVNLIRNGVEAMAVTGANRLDLRIDATSDSVRFEIRDHGSGIADFDRIFEPFFTTKSGGMGMGLAICRTIARAHGGSVDAEAAVPTGTRMILTLPAHTREEPLDVRS